MIQEALCHFSFTKPITRGQCEFHIARVVELQSMVKSPDFGSVAMLSDGILRLKVNKRLGRAFDGRPHAHFLVQTKKENTQKTQ